MRFASIFAVCFFILTLMTGCKTKGGAVHTETAAAVPTPVAEVPEASEMETAPETEEVAPPVQADALRKAAEQGDVEAQYLLGWMYDNGDGVPQDKAEAVVWYRRAAEQGDARAQYTLGGMYFYGEGVAEDRAQAIVWFRKAAVQGDAEAQYNLGMIFRNGYGIPEDREQATFWFEKAAEQGNDNARQALAGL